MTSERRWSGAGTAYVLAILRISYGLLWLQQTTWKVPPDFGMRSGGGLYYWTDRSRGVSAHRPSPVGRGRRLSPC